MTCRGSKGAHNVQWTLALCGPEQSEDVPSGKFRNSPKAGSGAEWLATLRNLPVISPPLIQHQSSSIFPSVLSNPNQDDSGFVVQEQTVKKRKKLHFLQLFLSETGWSCTTPIRSIGQSCSLSGTLYLFFALLLQHLPSVNAFLSYFPVISVFLFLLFCFRKVTPYCQSVFLLLSFCKKLKTVRKIQCRVHICLLFPIQAVFCKLMIWFLHCYCHTWQTAFTY